MSRLISRRLRNICLAFGVSIAMWVGIIQGSLVVYGSFQGVDSIQTASVSTSSLK